MPRKKRLAKRRRGRYLPGVWELLSGEPAPEEGSLARRNFEELRFFGWLPLPGGGSVTLEELREQFAADTADAD